MGLVKAFLGSVVPAVMKPLRVLWNEMLAFVFAVFAIIILFPALRQLWNFDGSTNSIAKLGMQVFFGGVMAVCAIFSFTRARKISKS